MAPHFPAFFHEHSASLPFRIAPDYVCRILSSAHPVCERLYSTADHSRPWQTMADNISSYPRFFPQISGKPGVPKKHDWINVVNVLVSVSRVLLNPPGRTASLRHAATQRTEKCSLERDDGSNTGEMILFPTGLFYPKEPVCRQHCIH